MVKVARSSCIFQPKHNNSMELCESTNVSLPRQAPAGLLRDHPQYKVSYTRSGLADACGTCLNTATCTPSRVRRLRFLKGCGNFDTLKNRIARLVGGAFYGVRLIKDKIGFSSEHKDKITLLSPYQIRVEALMANRHN
ncbi:hypothetical protein Zmor_001039 [Zophobas morio]|uniref:Uncharacterized protein n=1 Tax=Zophobas morio TaxID=2755281 RepID=A0AA38IYE1_9CUCU|nr:hypothetical protein Zmor_001039 [Zophobas morio]